MKILLDENIAKKKSKSMSTCKEGRKIAREQSRSKREEEELGILTLGKSSNETYCCEVKR